MSRKLSIRNLKFLRGQSLVEVLIGIAVVAIIFTSAAGLIFVSLLAAKASKEESLAQSLINHMSSAVRSIIDDDWHSLWSATGGVVFLSFDDGAGSANDNKLVLDELSGFNATIELGSSGNTSLASAWLDSSSCQAGQCLSFDNVDDYLWVEDTTATSSPIDLTNTLSFSAWIYPTDLTGYDPILAKVSTSTSTGYELANSSGALRLILKTPSVSCDYSAGSLTQNVWQHVAATYDGSAIRLYLNGQLIGSPSACSTGAAVNQDKLLIGARATDAARFAGRLDELRVYNRALSLEEISALYSGVSQMYPYNNGGVWQLKHGQESIEIANIQFSRSFQLERILRDGNRNIVSSGGDLDPMTKKVVFLVEWRGGRRLMQEEYVSRSVKTDVFTQTDWSAGVEGNNIVFLAPRSFDAADASIIFSTPGRLSSATSTPTSSLVSSIFDTQRQNGTVPLNIIWQGSLPSGTAVKFQLASANSRSGPWNFVGNDGTSSSYYPAAGSSQPNISVPINSKFHHNQRYLRYKIFLTSTVTAAPTVDDVSIVYAP